MARIIVELIGKNAVFADKNEGLKSPSTRYQPEQDGCVTLATSVPCFML